MDIHMGKNDPYSTPYTNNNLSWLLGLNVKAKIIKHLDEINTYMTKGSESVKNCKLIFRK